MIGRRFGRLVVVVDPGGKTRRRVDAQCDCGASSTVRLDHLLSGATRSCGCLLAEVRGVSSRTHGGHLDPTYHIWQQMRYRCQNPGNPAYARYGGRGISVAPEWEDYSVFIRDIGARPSPQHTIDRIDNDGNYEPSNVRWATREQQARNRRSTHFLTFNGETLCIKGWAEKLGVSYAALRGRIGYGMPVDQALTQPFRRLARRPA